jgi:AAA15 family ATPase/GTPase
MLSKIEVTNFKSFNDNFIFDLSDTSSFSFNPKCVKNKTVNKAIIYGQNGCGKSNLGFAIFDLVAHLTDKQTREEYYQNYLNADSNEKVATFKFTFKFDDNIVEYFYTKTEYKTLKSERLNINGNVFASIDKNKSNIFEISAKGAENLNRDMKDSNISIISYILNNTVLEENETNEIFKKFITFINKMLYFRHLDDRCYMGLQQGGGFISSDIVKSGKLKDFETFLNEVGIICKLISKKVGDEEDIYFKFKNKEIDFFDIASSGTMSLALFYVWYQKLKEENKVSLLFIDEFDAFYHHALSRTVIERLKEVTNTQVIVTTHNTSIISNDLLRPDCYFLMYPDKIKSLAKSTQKELREAHNIEKMYRAGSFE